MAKDKSLPNIILIVMDTAGAKHFSFYGYSRKTTPSIEEIAAESVVYTHCFSTSCWTSPAHASLFTGLYPSQHGTYEAQLFLNPNIYTLPEMLKALGYATYGISCNSVVSKAFGFSRGFDKFLETEKYKLFPEVGDEFRELQRLFAAKSNREKANILARMAFTRGKLGIVAKKIINAIYGRIKRRRNVLHDATPHTKKAFLQARQLVSNHGKRDNPYFLFLNVMQAHSLYNPPKEVRGYFSHPNWKCEHDSLEHYAKKPFTETLFKQHEALYDEELLFLDRQIGNFYAWLKDIKSADNTLLILTADHGEHLGEHGHAGHIFSLYNEVVRVPLVIKYPSWLKLQGAKNKLVQINDILATIFDLIQAPFPVPQASYSLLNSRSREIAILQIIDPRLWISGCKRRNPNFEADSDFIYRHPVFSLITSNMLKIITRYGEGGHEIYDLSHSWEEKRNLYPAAGGPDKLQSLTQLAAKLRETTNFNQVVEGLYGKGIERSER